jgi:hypothetical protein
MPDFKLFSRQISEQEWARSANDLDRELMIDIFGIFGFKD